VGRNRLPVAATFDPDSPVDEDQIRLPESSRLAPIGGVVGVFLAGGVAMMIGFITLFGVATRNGIMLVTHIHHLMDVEGVRDFREAVERGAKGRRVPILMTAAAAGLALIPLAIRC
jgi:Cu/Ag efflux pump CusA